MAIFGRTLANTFANIKVEFLSKTVIKFSDITDYSTWQTTEYPNLGTFQYTLTDFVLVQLYKKSDESDDAWRIKVKVPESDTDKISFTTNVDPDTTYQFEFFWVPNFRERAYQVLWYYNTPLVINEAEEIVNLPLDYYPGNFEDETFFWRDGVFYDAAGRQPSTIVYDAIEPYALQDNIAELEILSIEEPKYFREKCSFTYANQTISPGSVSGPFDRIGFAEICLTTESTN